MLVLMHRYSSLFLQRRVISDGAQRALPSRNGFGLELTTAKKQGGTQALFPVVGTEASDPANHVETQKYARKSRVNIVFKRTSRNSVSSFSSKVSEVKNYINSRGEGRRGELLAFMYY